MVFSIVTPTFKQPEWVRLCAASVADQVGVTFEHIIQDGGDGQGLEWLESMPRAHLFVEPDQGMYDALTKGISKATGDIIGHLNSDEQYLPGTFEIVHRFFTRNPEVEVVFGDAILIGADFTPEGRAPPTLSNAGGGILFASPRQSTDALLAVRSHHFSRKEPDPCHTCFWRLCPSGGYCLHLANWAT